MDWLNWLNLGVQIFIGFAGGIIVGSGLVALLIILDIVPRLVQVTKTLPALHYYEGAIIAGTMFWASLDFFNIQLTFHPLSTMLVGLLCGSFIGLLAGALTEVINVLPILAKRMGLGRYMIALLMAMILGKMLGALFEWFVYNPH